MHSWSEKSLGRLVKHWLDHWWRNTTVVLHTSRERRKVDWLKILARVSCTLLNLPNTFWKEKLIIIISRFRSTARPTGDSLQINQSDKWVRQTAKSWLTSVSAAHIYMIHCRRLPSRRSAAKWPSGLSKILRLHFPNAKHKENIVGR